MRKGFTLLEVLAVTILLAGFVVGFFESSQTIAAASFSQQNRLEALMVLLKETSRWRVDNSVTGNASGTFSNGTEYGLASNAAAFTQSGKGWNRLACTVSWVEPVLESQKTRTLTERRIAFKEL